MLTLGPPFALAPDVLVLAGPSAAGVLGVAFLSPTVLSRPRRRTSSLPWTLSCSPSCARSSPKRSSLQHRFVSIACACTSASRFALWTSHRRFAHYANCSACSHRTRAPRRSSYVCCGLTRNPCPPHARRRCKKAAVLLRRFRCSFVCVSRRSAIVLAHLDMSPCVADRSPILRPLSPCAICREALSLWASALGNDLRGVPMALRTTTLFDIDATRPRPHAKENVGN